MSTATSTVDPSEVAKFEADGTFQWIVPPTEDDPRHNNATWYCDGSMLSGKWQSLRATGFGIAVVSEQGDLLAYGLGWPPTWCSTAAAAEAWALHTVLDVCPFPPQLRTDCMALLSAAASGTARATHHSRPLARIWKAIGFTLGFVESQFEITAIAGLLMLCYFFLPMYRKLHVYTLSDYLARRFDDRSRMAYALIMLVIIVLIMILPAFYVGSRAVNILLADPAQMKAAAQAEASARQIEENAVALALEMSIADMARSAHA